MPSPIVTITKRELKSYFYTPTAYILIVIFLALSAFFTFNMGHFFSTNQADLRVFFQWHPWLYLFLVPAISMGLWAEERKTGTIELLLTMPIKMSEAVIGKFLAAWIFLGVALLLTFPMVLTVMYLGSPDLGVIWAGYISSFLMAGAYLAIGSCFSAMTKNQVISFIMSVVVIFTLIIISYAGSWLGDSVPDWLITMITNASLMNHFQSIQRGILDIRDVIYYVSMIVGFLAITVITIEHKKAD